MGYFRDVWKTLQFNAGNETSQYLGTLGWRYKNKTDNELKFVSRSAYKSVYVHAAKQLAISTLAGELNSLLPKYQKYMSDRALNAVRAAQEVNRARLIERGEKSTADYGYLDCEGGHRIVAKTKYGTPVPEALIISYTDKDSTHYIDTVSKSGDKYTVKKKQTRTLEYMWNPNTQLEYQSGNVEYEAFETKTVFHIDLAPDVSVSSTKNVVLTQVQGRDYSRKELVSGGDLTYSVSGNIVSDEEGVYPAEAVKRFVKIMQYNGMVDVNFITFGLLGVKKVIIKDFSLGHGTCKNIQPYSFTCVAVEPDEDIILALDTITAINQQISVSSNDSWYNTILQNKLVQMAAKTAINTANSATVSLSAAGLDSLVPNI